MKDPYAMVYYTLGGDDGHAVLPTTDMMAWARWYHVADRRVAETFTGLYRVSTVFLGLDHSWGDGPPVVFETMVFGKDGHDEEFDGEMWRYASWDDAETGHKAAVRRILKQEADAAKTVAEREKQK